MAQTAPHHLSVISVIRPQASSLKSTLPWLSLRRMPQDMFLGQGYVRGTKVRASAEGGVQGATPLNPKTLQSVGVPRHPKPSTLHCK